MAAAAPEAAPTFNWTGMGQPEGAHIHYQSFNFAGQHYTMGDCVYLLPEEEGSQPYIGRLMRAYEDTTAKEAERLVIEVQWFEPRASLPPAVAAGMHEQEVVESDLIDTNLVGCLDSKATIIQASSYEEAYHLLPEGHTGQWHFCRGTWDTERQVFRSYLEMGAMPGCYTQGFAPGAAAAMYQQYQQAALNGYGDPDQDYLMDDEGADLTPRSGGGRARGGRSRRSTAARSSAAVNAAAAAAAAAAGGSGGAVGYQRSGIPGKVCCECGATQTPQWREGPKGPKTLCNACGVRYQRQQSKAKSNKRLAADRGGGKDRGSSPGPHGGRSSKHARLSAASAGNTPDAAAAAAATMEDAFSAAALESHQLQQLQMAQLLNGAGADPTDPAAAAAAPAPAHHHGTRRNAKAAAAAAAVGGSPRGFRSSRQQHRGGGSLSGSDLGTGGGSSGGGSAGKGAHNKAMSAGKGEGAAGAAAAAAGKHKGPGHPALAAALAAAGEQLGFYSDERSPPNSNTRILEYEEEDGGQQQQRQQQQQDLARSNTHEAADALQNLAHNSQGHQQQQQLGNHTGEPQQHQQQQATREDQQAQQQRQQEQQRQQQAEQQQQQAQAAATATAVFFSALGSPATALLIAEQGMPSDSMPLLSLDDKYRPGTPSGLGVTDGLDGMNTHSLSPLKPNTQHMLTGSAAAAAAAAANAANGGLPIGRDSSTISMPRYGMPLSGPGAVCASPGRLISAMVQNLKLPAPLALNPGMSPLGAVTTLGMPSAGGMSQQQHQQHPGMLSDLLAGTGTAVGDGSGGGNRQQQHGDVGGGGGTGQHMGMDGPGGVGGGADGHDNRLLTQLRSLLYRASVYTPDVSGLSGLYPGPATPRSVQQLVDQLEALPESDKARVQQASTTIEDSLSKAKAAEAAVLAVTQVLATKQNAAAEAKAEVERSVLQLRCVLNQLNPAVAAAAAGNGGYSSAAATPTAADAAATAAAANAAAAAAAASNGLPAVTGTSGYLGQSFALSNGTGLSNGAGGMLGLAQGVGHPYGPAAVMAQGPMTMADTDDLLRDPDDVPAAAAAPQQQHQHQQQLSQMQLKQEAAAGLDGALADIDQQVQDKPQQQQHQQEAAHVRQEGTAELAIPGAAGNAASEAANGPQVAPMAAAEPAPVAA